MISTCPLHDRERRGLREVAKRAGIVPDDADLPPCTCSVAALRFNLAVVTNRLRQAEAAVRSLQRLVIEDDPKPPPPKTEPPEVQPEVQPAPAEVLPTEPTPTPPLPPREPYIPVDPYEFVEARIRELCGEN